MSLESVIHNLVSSLGGVDISLEDKPYILGDDGLACLKDLKRLLQHYDHKYNSWDVKRILADTNFVEGDLCPILSMWDPLDKEDKVKWRVCLACVELLVELTWPLEVNELNANKKSFEQLPHLRLAQSFYKKSVLNYCKANVLFNAISVSFPSMSIARTERSERDEGIIRLVLYFIRNIAMIDQETTRNETILAFKKANILDLIISVAGGIGNEFICQDVIILEIVFYLVRGINPENIFLSDKAQSLKPLDDLSNLLKIETDKKKTVKTTRHNRFGTLISLIAPNNRRFTVANQGAILKDAENGFSKIDSVKKWKMRKSRISTMDDLDKPVFIMHDATMIISAFINEFLDLSFNPLFSSILRCLEREETRISQENHIHFLYCIGYFIHALRLRLYSKNLNDSSKYEDYGLIATMLQQRALIMIYKLMRESFDLKIWKELHSAMECFKQILLIVNCMTISSQEYQEIADNMQNNMYYDEHNLDLIINVIKLYKTQSFGFLNISTELVHNLLKMLEKYSKTKDYMYVRVRQRQNRKKDVNASNQEEALGSDNDNSQLESKLRYKERSFEFSKFEKKFVNDHCIDTFRTFLEYYRELTPEQIKRVISFFYRIFVKQKAEIYLFRLDICELFNRMLNDDIYFSKSHPTRVELEKFIKFYMKRLISVISKSPALYVELLFHKMHDTVYYLQHGCDEVAIPKPIKLSAEFEVKPGMDFEQQISIVVAVLLDENKSYELDWLKIKLSDAISQRKAWELEKESRESLEDSYNKDLLSLPPRYVVIFESEQQRKKCFKNGKLRLLISLCGFLEEKSIDDIMPSLIIPSEISSSTLSYNLGLVKKYIDNPPIFDDGKTAIDFLRRKYKPRNHYDASSEEDETIDRDDFDSIESMSSAKIFKKRHRKLLNDEELNIRAERRKKLQEERMKIVKSLKYVIDSDNTDDDAAFFASEEILRKKSKLMASKSHEKNKNIQKSLKGLDFENEINNNDSNLSENYDSSEIDYLTDSEKDPSTNNDKLFIDDGFSTNSNTSDFQKNKQISILSPKNLEKKNNKAKGRRILIESSSE
ncbi:hypothetical protein T552_00501 [Pneumocystis carinii B80]|uniref:Timeless N-terminal domain-containing protein n=1 Tax=Pneumocystis carinii (strain B80) TaxID=1408658 RepID=A0A0W4ZQY8_PNEC8|nr:hypothetical protein T552_00501 [Pneumocystis carinii B80]KTW30789.1 hypothetical protein T552_00501 [Pneumocystis carinii B80]